MSSFKQVDIQILQISCYQKVIIIQIHSISCTLNISQYDYSHTSYIVIMYMNACFVKNWLPIWIMQIIDVE